jgi:hypothetical protein
MDFTKNGQNMSSGNSWVDAQIAAAGSLLADQWKKNPRAVQPENNLKPDAASLQFRIKLLEDRLEQAEKILRSAGLMR